MTTVYKPGTTYRIQFNKDFTLAQLRDIVTYLKELGVTTVYASPIFSAVPGSVHGYDVTDANSINSEIGTLQQLEDISRMLHAAGIGWLQDIVPNHMAYDVNNTWLTDVLCSGQASDYAGYFDINWNDPKYPGKIMLPVLDKPLSEAIDNGEVKVVMQDGKAALSLMGVVFPLAGGSGTVSEYLDKEALAQLVQQQYYQPCEWQETDSHINYRRFFTINGMICLNMQDEQVFEQYHELVRQLVDGKLINGLRVDHIDGLYDPTEYLYSLREMAGDDAYITVEKILEPGEELPGYWPVQGTTGYDFIAIASSLFTAPGSMKQLTELYTKVAGSNIQLTDETHDKKELILTDYMQGELETLYTLFVAAVGENVVDKDRQKKAIAAFLIYCPVYRFYSNALPLDVHEARAIKQVLDKIAIVYSDLLPEINQIERLLFPVTEQGKNIQAKAAHFFKRCMQYSGPLMAKGVEDTLMYTYNRLLGYNEVGDSPEVTRSTVAQFHDAIQHRQAHWPQTMNATATHDTKRGEDARARLLAITNMPDEWRQVVNYWHTLNEPFKINGTPDYNDEYFIYQAIVASYPMPGQPDDNFKERLHAYIQKAMRESKLHTTWSAPDEDYETHVAEFIDHILGADSAFMKQFSAWHKRIADAGIVNSLAQLILKCTCPGIPDIYQGGELWDLSMVDPDNRRAVDYAMRKEWLREIHLRDTEAKLPAELWKTRYNGKIKLWLTHSLLQARKKDNDLFAHGAYMPLEVTGKYKDNIIAYARHYEDRWFAVVLPLHMLMPEEEPVDWGDTTVVFPAAAEGKYEHKVSGSIVAIKGDVLIKELFGTLPFAMLSGSVKEQKRKAGILLPAFSLPSPYGIGDFGDSARAFADFLHKSGQKYWQLLPVNPIDGGSMYSPYSSRSSMAMNVLLISPDHLVADGLLERSDTSKHNTANTGRVDYEQAAAIKTILLRAAYEKYCAEGFMALQYGFDEFCRQEHYWLDDYALYMALKQAYPDVAWSEWPDEYKNRNERALAEFARVNNSTIHELKWLQYIVARQWTALRKYCNNRSVKLFGDLPFYVSYDSADVWANPDLFTLDSNGRMMGVAGVPPDYFSEDGQLWGVPTFNWDKLKETGYAWWVCRLQKNIALFDVVRIDHFRALAAYWQVPAGEATAKNGQWLKGPGIDFFNVLEERLGKLPFIAEDLGYDMDDVYALREESGLPGMKVLEFAWGHNVSVNVDIPHNYPLNCIVYTGTHDNNTIVGWYKNETSNDDRLRMQEYTGREIHQYNVHKVMNALAYGSVAEVAILPVQDVLGLDEHARMNTPGTIHNNWQWRMADDAINDDVAHYLYHLCELYNR